MIADFKERNKNRVTEEMVEKYLDIRQMPFIRYGLDNLDMNFDTYPMYKVSAFVRSAPDYIAFTGSDKTPIFVEAKGFRGDVKVKLHDLKNYSTWNSHMHLEFVFYNTENRSYCQISLNDLLNVIKHNNAEIDYYPESENNKFYIIKTSWLPDFSNL